MASKLIWGILGGVVLGAILGSVAGNTPIGIAICIVAGAVAAFAWHRMEQRNPRS
jgi:F0F1-type ATP synthase assembly protein I